jgi:hypothetical protein
MPTFFIFFFRFMSNVFSTFVVPGKMEKHQPAPDQPTSHLAAYIA